MTPTQPQRGSSAATRRPTSRSPRAPTPCDLVAGGGATRALLLAGGRRDVFLPTRAPAGRHIGGPRPRPAPRPAVAEEARGPCAGARAEGGPGPARLVRGPTRHTPATSRPKRTSARVHPPAIGARSGHPRPAPSLRRALLFEAREDPPGLEFP